MKPDMRTEIKSKLLAIVFRVAINRKIWVRHLTLK
jgi:hypothetical protein